MRGWAATLMAACALLLAACGERQRADSPPLPGDIAVARVDGATIWASDVRREAVVQGLISQGEPLDTSSPMFRQVMEEVIDQKLMATAAVARDLDEGPAAQRRLGAARERVLGDLLVEDMIEKAVSEKAIEELFEEQRTLSSQSEEIRARHIVLATEAEAREVRDALKAGGSFEVLAMERSTDPVTRFDGGDMGYMALDVMPESYQVALETAQPGQVLGPFAVDGGFAVVKLEDRRLETPVTLEEARPQIVRFLTYDQVRGLLQDLRARAKVETLLKPAPDVPGAPKEPATAPPAKDKEEEP